MTRINLFAPISGNGGYQIISRTILKALIDMEYDVKVITSGPANNPTLEVMIKESSIKSMGDKSLAIYNAGGAYNFAGKERIIYPMYEGNKVPKEQVVALNSCDKVLVSSPFFVNVFANSGVKREKIKVLNGAVDPVEYRPMSFSRAINNTADEFVFGMAGKYEVRKSSYETVKAFLRVFDEHPMCNKVKLKLKWTTSTAARTLNQIKFELRDMFSEFPNAAQRVEIINQVDIDMNEFYNTCDLFLFPSKAEGIGLPLLEAMACQVPTLTTPYTSLKDIANSKTSIILPDNGQVPMEDSFYGFNESTVGTFGLVKYEDIADGMLKFLSMSKEERLTMGQKARDHVVANYSLESMKKNLQEVL